MSSLLLAPLRLLTKNYQIPLFILLLGCLVSKTVLAQRQPRDSTYCAAPELTTAQRAELDKLAKLALQLKRAAGNAFSSVTWVPVRPHIIRTSAGTGGIDLTRLNNVIALTNSYYLTNGVGIQFYLAGSVPDYIDNDALFQSFPYGNETSINGRDATMAMNVYFVNAFSLSGLQGYAYFPANDIQTTRSFILADPASTDRFLGNILIPHEWGHNFNLLHTFQGSTSSTPELVTRTSGANCTTAGDLICDTPADPYGRSGASISYINGCPVYTGTATDPQGATYTPSMTNIMSYYDGCTSDFTPGQYDRIEAGLALRQTHTAYSLTYPPSAVSPPINLLATLGTSRHVSLSWQHGSGNAMGYIVERATAAGGPFVPIGGTGPDATIFTDTKAATSTTYYYRIRPSNTTTGAISNITSVATGTATTCVPAFAMGCSQGDGLTSLFLNGNTLSHQSGCSTNGYHEFTGVSATVTAGQTCQLSGRLLSTAQANGVAIFLDLNRDGAYTANERVYGELQSGLFSGTIALPNSLTSGMLGMRVIATRDNVPVTACLLGTYGETEDYTLLVLANGCAAPVSISTAASSNLLQANLSWATVVGATAYDFRWKDQASANWFTVDAITAASFTLTALTSGGNYQWQIRSVCGTDKSVWVGETFNMLCASPTNLIANTITNTSAQLSWSTLSSTYDLLWRVDGGNWQTISGLSSPAYSLTGLSMGRSYQWRVRCGSNPDNPYSPISTFVTTGTCRATYSVGCVEGDGFESVMFNGVLMSRTSGCLSSAYRAYTTPVAPVAPGRPYSFSGTLLSSYGQGIGIWLDLNRNNVFEASERLYASNNTFSVSFAGSLTVPASATPGPVTMRMVAVYAATPTDPCGSYTYGEVEDYTLMIYAADVVQVTQRADPACLNSPLPVSFATTAAFAPDNVFTVQLSDATGTFGASPTALTSVAASTGRSLSVTIPNTVSVGNNYQLRVVSSNPATVNNPSVPLRITVSCSCPVPTSLIATTIGNTSADVAWSSDATVSSYSLRRRQLGSQTWVYTDYIPGTELPMRFLSSGTTYEWQVLSVCLNGQLSDWSPVATFQTTSCGSASLLPASLITMGGSPISLTVAFTGSSPWSFNLSRNGLSWYTASGLTASPFSFTTTAPGNSTFTLGSAAGSCGAIPTSGTVEVTVLCGVPSALNTPAISVSSASLNWTGNTNQGYELRWRPLNSAVWSTTLLGSTATSPTFGITGLTANTIYEWQVRSVCANNVSSAFSSSAQFTTESVPTCFSMVTTKSGQWNDATVWSCGRIPNSSDNVTVLNTHIIVIPANTTAVASQLTNNGKLFFEASTSRLRLGYVFSESLIAYYPFNGNANDESGNGHHGVVNGATLTTDRYGNASRAYSFDGDDWIRITSNPAFRTNDFTLSSWVNLAPTSPSSNMILAYPANEADENAWHMNITQSATQIDGYTYQSSYVSVPVSASTVLNTWRHLVYTKTGTTAKLYLDGVLLGSHTVSATVVSNNPRNILMGADDDYGLDGLPDRWWYHGKIDDVRIYGRGFSANEVQQLFQSEMPFDPSVGLIAYYPFNGNANDVSGNGHNGTVVNATLTTDRFGNADKAYSFDGNQDYINIGNLPLMPQFSISSWAYVTQFGSFQCLLSGINNDLSYRNFELRVEYDYAGPTGRTAFLHIPYNNEWPAIISDEKLLSNTWYHITATWDGATARLYLNGNLVKSSQFNGYSYDSATHFIGGRPAYVGGTYHGWFNGKLDGVRVYNRALNALEVQGLFSSTTD